MYDTQVTVGEQGGRLYVDVGTGRYWSDDLPAEGTEVEIDWEFTGTDGRRGVDVRWPNDSPAGVGFARAYE